ncbi:uncharacterized protein LOC144707525 [Wolffia australiana]
MGNRGRPFLDLNEPPSEVEIEEVVCILPQNSLPESDSSGCGLINQASGTTWAPNSRSFSHATSASGFQPFVRQKKQPLAAEREEGEWSDVEDGANHEEESSNTESDQGKGDNSSKEPTKTVDNACSNVSSGQEGSTSDSNSKGLEDTPSEEKPKVLKGVEANHAIRMVNNFGKRPKPDEHKEAMLGKRRNRQTVFLNIDEVKQAGPIKCSTPKRQPSFSSSSLSVRAVKESVRPIQPANKENRIVDVQNGEGSLSSSTNDQLAESNGDKSRPMVQSSGRQGLWKQPSESRPSRNATVSLPKQNSVGILGGDSKASNRKNPPSKKLLASTSSYQDTSVERLLREVTSDKFWHHPEDTDLQCVPGRFESSEEYVRVFEPLLFEECRAQLYSTWEELSETSSRDAHLMVRVKSVERRERGWYDVIVLPAGEFKWNFKEGDVAVLSQRKPTAVRSRKGGNSGGSEEEAKAEASSRAVGTVRRHSPIDIREPPGAILHFYVGDAYDSSGQVGEDHVLRKFVPKTVWYLTVLGSLATTQREYIALHAFRHLHSQMQTAILKPSPEQFPKYEAQPPGMPECFTPNFADHLRRTFNGPQLAAIQWAAMHTAAGTSGGVSNGGKKPDPWPFTLVQGPPGTGKTHTVWGMLNVIHLVQYQHYYAGLLKKLAPESCKPGPGPTEGAGPAAGSIDEVLQSMDQSLLRTLPKLCPKPRMLVCAPSNAATDELLSRVLDRGFIDGEMKVYRPDVARVGVDSQTRAAQAVSVERRTEQLLDKRREEVVGWMAQLRASELQWAQKISLLQKELLAVAAVGRAQGAVGVDPDLLSARDHSRDLLLQQLAAAVEARDKVLVELSRLLIVEARFRPGPGFNLDEARARLEASFASEAEIVFTTVSSSGRKLFSRIAHGFDMVVIDEAAQASEVAILPPLSLGAARCVLVGDPQQLPATVISRAAGTLLYSRSLLERFQQAGCPTLLLTVQYRMHPQIREFPSRYFYQGRLADSDSVARMGEEEWLPRVKDDPMLRPYVFFDVAHGRETHRGGSVSFQNVQEAHFCRRLYERVTAAATAAGRGRVTVGVITPYKLQLKCIQREFDQVVASEQQGKEVYINTVDAFQGQERDVIIMSCVRASRHGVGFVADVRRMNVALTRARRALWVVGNASALMQSEDWAALIADAKARKCFMDVDSIPKDFLLPAKPFSPARPLRPVPGHRHRHVDAP